MKRKITFLIAALCAVMLITQPGKAVGQTTVTYAQSNCTTASVSSGTAPSGSSVTFSNTYTNNNSSGQQISNGNTATYTLSGFEGYKITGIKLSMHSNASNGSGYLSVTAGSTSIASIGSSSNGIAFNNAAWNGAFTTSWVDITPTLTTNSYVIQEAEDVVIVVGSTNKSLYCQSVSVTYEAASSIKAPTFSPTGSRFYETQDVELDCETENTDIYYTIGVNPANPTNSSTKYTTPIEVSSTKTIKAIAYDKNDSNKKSSVATKTYTIEAPLTTMSAVYNKAVAVGTTATDVFIDFDDWVVVATTDNDAYVTDGQYGLWIYGASHGFTSGTSLSGIADCTVELDNTGAKLTNLTASELTVTSSSVGEAYQISLADLDGKYFGSYVDFGNLIYDYDDEDPSFRDPSDNEYIYLMNPFSVSYGSFEDGFTYHVKGVYYNDGYRELAPRVAADIALAPASISITTPIVFPASDDADIIDVTYANIIPTSGSVTLYDNEACSIPFSSDWFEVNFAEDTKTTVYDYTKIEYYLYENDGSSSRDVYMKVVVSDGEKTELTKVVKITQESYCTITFHGNGGLSSGNDTYTQQISKNIETNLTANTFARTGYVFNKWNTSSDGTGTNYSNQASVTLTDDLDLYATWSLVPTYTLVTNANQIVPGAHYIIASSKDVTGELVYDYAMGAQSGNTRPGVQIKVKSGTPNYIEAVTGIKEVVISGPDANGKWTMYDEDGVEISSTTYHFVASTSTSSNYITATNGSTDNAKWSIEFDETSGQVKLTAASGSKNLLKMNDSSHAFTCYGSSSTGVSWGYLYRKDNDSNIHPYSTSEYSSGDDVTISDDITLSDTYKLTIGNGAIVRFTGTLATANATNLVIEDGGQLITSSSVQLTYKKGITSAAKDGGWYTISTPVHTASNTFLEHESVENMILTPATNYDLFYYNETTHYWMNYKQAEFDLNVGQGYLYRNNGAELHFAGYNNQATSYNVALSYASTENKLLGFNLIGNPYPQNITMSDVTVNNGGTLSGGYVLSKDGAWSADVAATIAPAQGFLVQIDKTGVTATITKPTGGSKSRANNDYIKFIVANSQHEDAAFALFEEGYGLNKIDHRNSDIPMLYIPKEGHNFAIATMDDNTQSFNLNLKAKTTGKYTLTYKATGNYSYLHVIDRLTGEDVDMLMEGEYSFIASPSDAENRFIVRLEYSNGYENSEDSIFAYQSGSDIIVNGEGELQIFDVMGRRILTQYVSGVETINLQSHGVYIFKLNEKTQKIVVR